MKILVLGDIHGRRIWKDIIDKEDPDKVIFLGDYVSTHDRNVDSDQQIEELYAILDYKDNNKEKVILLRGNHDLQHLGYYWAECSGLNSRVLRYMSTEDVRGWYLSLTQWIYPLQIDDKFLVFSHAGISNTWYDSVKKKTNISCIADINTLEPSELFAFTPCKFSDYCGESATQPCTWIRPWTLLSDMPERIIQIVGHTPMKNGCMNYKIKTRELYQDDVIPEYIKDCPDLWCCDALDVNSYLIIEDGNFHPKTYEQESSNTEILR